MNEKQLEFFKARLKSALAKEDSAIKVAELIGDKTAMSYHIGRQSGFVAVVTYLKRLGVCEPGEGDAL